MRPRYAPILVATALLLSAASGSDKKHQNQSDAHYYNASRKSDPAPSPITIIVQPAPVQIIQPRAPIEKPQATQKWYQRPTVTDWGVLGITLLYTAIALGLLNATRTSLAETRKTADAAIRSAKAAESSADAARLALHSDRPYLLVTGITQHQFKHPLYDAEEPISSVRLSFCNVGQSPANMIALYATSWKYDCLLSGEEPRWANLNSGGDREIKAPIVGVGETTEPISISINWTEDDMNRVYGGAKRGCYLWRSLLSRE
jgi:hypothetical protein